MTFGRLARDASGNVLVIGAAALPLLIGAAGLATDTVLWTLWKRDLQRAADSAAMAGALTLQQARYKAEEAAKHDFKKSKAFKELKGKMIYQNSPKSGPWASDSEAVYVEIEIRKTLPFSNFFMKKTPTIKASATATLTRTEENCLISLEESSASAIHFDGNSNVSMNCGVISNSGSSSAVVATGSANVEATTVAAVGRVPVTSHYVGETKLADYHTPQVDPYRSLPPPNAPKTCSNAVLVEPKVSSYITPGCYKGMTLKGTVTFAPGVYYVTTADLLIASGANIRGEGVTFILTTDKKVPFYPRVVIEGSPTISLRAPTSDTYEGVLFYGDPAAPYDRLRQHSFAGSASSLFEGSMYFPNSHVRFAGNAGMNLACFKLVSRTMTLTGTSNFGSDCASRNAAHYSEKVRLVA